MPLSFSNAVTIAQVELNKVGCFSNHYILLTEDAIDTPYGWLIPLAQSNYRTTKGLTIGGNSPFFVDRFTGEVTRPHFFNHEWLEDYAKKHGHKKGDG